jgi:hypothetical protein
MGLFKALRTHHSAAAKVRGNAAAPKPKQDAFLAVFGDAVLHSTARSQDSILSSFGGSHLPRPPCLKDPADEVPLVVPNCSRNVDSNSRSLIPMTRYVTSCSQQVGKN